MLSLSNVPRFRRYVGCFALVAGPLALAVSMALKVVSNPDPTDMLTAAGEHHSKLVAGDAAQLVAVVFLLPAIMALLHLLRGRGAALAHVGCGLLLLNLIGNAADVTHGALLAALSGNGVSGSDVAVEKALSRNGVYTASQLLVLVGLLGFPLVAAALWRSSAVPRAIPALLVVSVVSFFFPIPEVLGAALMTIAFGAIAAEVLRGTDEQWERGWIYEPATPAVLQPA